MVRAGVRTEVPVAPHVSVQVLLAVPSRERPGAEAFSGTPAQVCFSPFALPSSDPATNRTMKLRIRRSNAKKARKGGFRARQRTVGGRKVIKRQRARHGAI